MASELVYFDIGVGDTGKAKRFYGSVLGWEFADGNSPDAFHVVNVSPPGGVHGTPGPAAPRVYFRVDDLETAIDRITALGGQAGAIEPTESGRYVHCTDDQGIAFSLWQPA